MLHKTIFGKVRLGKEYQIVSGPDKQQLQESLFAHDMEHYVSFTLSDKQKAHGIVAALEVDERVIASNVMLDSFIIILQTSGGARGGRVEYNTETKTGKFWEIDPIHGPCL